MVLLLGGL